MSRSAVLNFRSEPRVATTAAWDNEPDFQELIRVKLEESEAVANDPTAKRYTHEEIFAPLRERYGYEAGSKVLS
ncbi:MAG: hypothetical protein FWG87_08015 [Defluviitaleaceae bacterium]|nr:hypothetical protein [Defluviitaleaceae bacterium]